MRPTEHADRWIPAATANAILYNMYNSIEPIVLAFMVSSFDWSNSLASDRGRFFATSNSFLQVLKYDKQDRDYKHAQYHTGEHSAQSSRTDAAVTQVSRTRPPGD